MRRAAAIGARVAAVAALVAPALVVPAPAHASFHLIKVVEVFAGTPGAPDAHLVELQMFSGGQTFITGQTVKIFAADGTEVGSFAFTDDAAVGTDQSRILVATPEAEAFFGVQADLEMTAVIPASGGRACFSTIDCVAWGAYTGPAGDAGAPFNPAEGIASGAAIVRDIAGGTRAGALDAGDDSNQSAADWGFEGPTPTNNAGATGSAPGGTFRFPQTTVAVAEGTTAAVPVRREGGTGPSAIDFATADGTAIAPDDYGAVAGSLDFPDLVAERPVTFEVVADDLDEGGETLLVRLTSPANGAVLATPYATVVIGDSADVTAPASQVVRPVHGGTYRAARLTRFRGTASDDVSGVDHVEVALLRKMRDGSCRWLNGTRFVRRSCTARLWNSQGGNGAWTFVLAGPLRSSSGGDIRHYVLYSRAVDLAGNAETLFEKGRNVSRFEIR